MSNIPFRVMRGQEDVLLSKPQSDGTLYFALDTGKIYLDTLKDDKVPLGRNSGIYYGSRAFAEDEVNVEKIDFEFDIATQIDGDQIPNLDDLILNLPDGGFYRVIELYETTLIGRRIAVSGSGGGPGGGGDSSFKPVIQPITKGTQYFVASDTQNMKIQFYCTSNLETENNYIQTVKYYFGKQVREDNTTYEFGKDNIISFDVSNEINYFSTSTANTLKVEVIDANGNMSYQKSFDFYLIELKLSSDADSIKKIDLGSLYSYPCTPQGGVGTSSMYLDFSLAPQNNQSNHIWEYQRPITNVNTNYSTSIELSKENIPSLVHGTYLLTVRFCGIIASNGKIVSSNPEYVQLAIYEDGREPLVASNFISKSISQYDSFELEYMIVDNESEANIIPIIKYGQNSVSLNATLNVINYWTMQFTKADAYDMSIIYKDTVYPLGKLTVIPYSGNLPVINANDTEIYFTAMGKSNASTDKDLWENLGRDKYNNKPHQAKFENFLWGTQNGWVEKDGETALKLTNGAKVTFPTYYPFAKDALQDGFTIEIDYSCSNISDYSKPLIQCLSKYVNEQNETVIQTGFHITGQKATLNSKFYKATTMAIVGEEDEKGDINKQDMALQAFTQYFDEGSRIHLAYVFERVPTLVADKTFYYVYTYLNGVLSGLINITAPAGTDLTNRDSFKDQSGYPATLEIDSTYGDILVYNIRSYRQALDAQTIINNYIADTNIISKKAELYAQNNIFTNDGFINIKAIQNIGYQLGIPYVLFNGGNSMQKKFNQAFTYDNTSFALPSRKDDYRFMKMQMYDGNGSTTPLINIPIEAKQETDQTNIKTNFTDMEKGVAYLPTRGVQVYGQGTSSMVYPVKNLRLKFIQENDYPTVYKGSFPVEIVCFKADFMDSSSAHNTGTGNLVYDLYQELNMKTPPQQFKIDNKNKDGVAVNDITTAIKGYPIICFYAPGDSEDYQYIGRYNFNLDKATPEPFGFIPQTIYTGETVIDEQGRERKVVDTCGHKVEIINGKTVLPLDTEGKEIKRDIIQCWEFLNNDANTPVKFRNPQSANGVPMTTYLSTQVGDKRRWMEYFEDRHPDKMVSGAAWELGNTEEKEYKYLDEDLNNGLFRLISWVNSTAVKYGEGEGEIPSEATNMPLENGPIYYQTLDKKFDSKKTYYIYKNNNYEAQAFEIKPILEQSNTFNSSAIEFDIDVNIFIAQVDGTGTYSFQYIKEEGESLGKWYSAGELIGNDLSDYGITYTGLENANSGSLMINYTEQAWTQGGNAQAWSSAFYERFDKDTDDYRLAKFKNEFTNYFNLEYCKFYYVLTLSLLMMDSRAKNMMLASWDQNIWYPIFYDMDTMLGVNNTGFNKFSFDTEDRVEDKVFNGYDSVLWNNFKICFESEIASFYASLRDKMTLNKLLECYNTNQADAWNEALISADAIYKYRRPYNEGYYDGKEKVQIDPGGKSYLYAAQGKRSNHRNWWLGNRLNYFDSKFLPMSLGSQKPSESNTFSFRAYALPEQQMTEKAAECVAQTRANHKFNLQALNSSYQSIFIGTSLYGPKYTLAGAIAELGPDDVRHEVEAWILNPTLIADLGDLSDKYIGSWQFPSTGTKLTSLKFGRSSRSHADYDKYYNKQLSELGIGNTCPYLKNINIARCTGLKTINLQQCNRLEVVDAEFSGLTGITLPQNSALRELYLPNTLEALSIINAPYLLTLQVDGNNNTNIKSIVLENVLNNTYNTVRRTFYDALTVSRQFKLTNINWTITNSEELVQTNNVVTGIKLLDILNSDKAQVAEGYALTKAQALTGTLTIDATCVANKFDIYQKYLKIFPNLNIIFTDKVTSPDDQKTFDVVFMKDDVSDDVLLTLQSNGQLTIGELLSNTGLALKNPSKEPTDQFNYHWNKGPNEFDFSEPGNYVEEEWYVDGNASQKFTADSIKNEQPQNTIVYRPLFSKEVRKYTIYLKDGEGKTFKEDMVKYGYSYNLPLYHYYAYSYNPNNPYGRWEFMGWIDSNDKENAVFNPQIYNGSIMVYTNRTFYADYVEQDYTTDASRLDYFDLNGNIIKLKDDFKPLLQGPITLPLKYGNNNMQLTTIGTNGFVNANKITEIYFAEGDNHYTTIEQNAFKTTKITKINLPSTITTIGNNSFQECSNLITIGNISGIRHIGDAAFQGCYDLILNLNEMDNLATINGSAFGMTSSAGAQGISGSTLQKVTNLKTYAFQYCPNVNISDFTQITSASHLSLNGCGKNVTTIELDANNLMNYASKAFEGYARTANILKVYGCQGVDQTKLLEKISDIGLTQNWTTKEFLDYKKEQSND